MTLKAIVERVVGWHLAHGGVSRFEKFRHFHREFLGRELDVDEERRLGERFSCLVEDAVVASPWVAGAREFLDAQVGRLPLHVASGTPEGELKRIVERRGMRHYFTSIHGSLARKAEILKIIASEGGFTASRLLMVGDAMTDFEGAVEAGASFVGRVPPDQESPFPAGTCVVADLQDLSTLCA